MKALLTADVHLTSKPEDAYRFKSLETFCALARVEKPDAIFILGDLTDKKDRHSAVLVNQTCRTLQRLARVAPVHILKGNHDYTDPDCPFFGFVNTFENVTFHTQAHHNLGEWLLLPHTRTPVEDWWMHDLTEPLVLMHQTVAGAVASNGQKMEGELTSARLGPRPRDSLWISGDIHVPQKVGEILYVGAPHPVRFGDSYSPRFILFKSGRWRSIPHSTIRKLTEEVTGIDDLSLIDFNPGDQLKLSVRLLPRELPQWNEIRADIIAFCEVSQILLSSAVPVVASVKNKRVQLRKQRTLNVRQTLTDELGRLEKIDQDIALEQLEDLLGET